ncbi:MAG TPA: ISNCY family transposase [Candidatus Acidoferrales bacterium]|nr:ISNCY family transposase [Candidatus Acidoferrales bacterium]
MRQRFEQQMNLRTVAISDVKFPLKSRDELPPVLMALQYIFVTPELNKKVFELLEKKICKSKKKTGRKGMDLWHLLVLAVVRHGLGTNWDRLEYLANYDQLLRSIMGVHATAFIEDEKIEFNYQTILDNVSLIDEDLLREVNLMVVDAGHKLLKKKDDEALKLKTDSYAAETNVHFPTDLNLLWDSGRKCLDMVEDLLELAHIKGWRKIKNIRKTFKSQFRATSQKVFKGRDEHQKKQSVKQYLYQSKKLVGKIEEVIKNPPVVMDKKEVIMAIIALLLKYKNYATKFIDQIERRLLKGEAIPSEEKIFSIFEEHTEWLTKGKLNKKVELGHLLLVTTDQYQFIVDYKVLEKQRDASQVSNLCERIKKYYPAEKIKSHSFDKGFWSKDNFEILQKAEIEQVILPKRGRHSKKDKERESDPAYKKLRNAHSAVESNINMLEHHGLNRCMDKGLHGFKKYVGLSVLAYNLHILGNALKANAKAEEERRKKQRLKTAA